MVHVHRATIDTNVIRAAVDENRTGHADASRLLAAAARGDVKLAVPPQGSLADLHGQYEGDLAGHIQALLAKPGVVELPQVARLSDVTFPAEDLFPGHFVARFDEAWDAVAADWKTHQGACPGDEDRWYVESHLLAGNDVLTTDDRALRAMCDRLRVEHGLAVTAESLSEFAAKFAQSGPTSEPGQRAGDGNNATATLGIRHAHAPAMRESSRALRRPREVMVRRQLDSCNRLHAKE
jgi:hypothetical protein